jgi:hypothetical protein
MSQVSVSKPFSQAPGVIGRRYPPIVPVAIASMALVIIGGIYMAAHLPAKPPVALPTVLLILAAVLVVANLVTLSRLREFCWPAFFTVGKWALLAYCVIAGMLEYVFIFDGTKGSSLILLTGMLLIYAVDVPLMLAFSVARYQALE